MSKEWLKRMAAGLLIITLVLGALPIVAVLLHKLGSYLG